MELKNIFNFNLKKFGIGLAIVIVFALFVNYGINTFYKAPQYNDFCNPERNTQPLTTSSTCTAAGGLWTPENVGYAPVYGPSVPAKPMAAYDIKTQQPVGYCNPDYACANNFNTVNDVYRRNVFIVWIIAGIAAIGGSFFITSVAMLSTSFMFGGLLALLIGTLEYWSAMQDYLRFIILGIALACLVYMAYKKLKD